MNTSLLFVKVKIEVKQEEQLRFHQVDLGDVEELGIDCPVFILRGRVVDVLCGDNEGSQEDTVTCTRNTYGSRVT
jgi:hypothetical protein